MMAFDVASALDDFAPQGQALLLFDVIANQALAQVGLQLVARQVEAFVENEPAAAIENAFLSPFARGHLVSRTFGSKMQKLDCVLVMLLMNTLDSSDEDVLYEYLKHGLISRKSFGFY